MGPRNCCITVIVSKYFLLWKLGHYLPILVPFQTLINGLSPIDFHSKDKNSMDVNEIQNVSVASILLNIFFCENSVIIYSSSCHSKSVFISFFSGTQKKIFWRMLASRWFQIPLASIVNKSMGPKTVINIIQNILFCESSVIIIIYDNE